MSKARRRAKSPPRASVAPRVEGIDALRGGALLLMFVYHTAFDLRFFHVIAADFEHGSFWLGFRALILCLFLGLVGMSLVLAEQSGVPLPRVLRRLGIVAAAAVAATLGSYVLFPATFIQFGVLHCVVVASLLARPFVRIPAIALIVGALVVAAGIAFHHPLFDAPALSWVGFRTVKPQTEDYVPLFPWAGIVLFGIAAGAWLAERAFRPLAPLAGAPRWLRFLGRHSLIVYLLHQPILMGLVWLLVGEPPTGNVLSPP